MTGYQPEQMRSSGRHAWIDISAGVAGDMLLGALLDAGAALGRVQDAVDAVIPGAVEIEVAPEIRGGQRALKARVSLVADDPPHRTWRTIRGMLEAAVLPESIRRRALDTFAVLARAEGGTHGVDPEDVHFHEVGALDAIADVVGTCAALDALGVETVSASPVAVGSGRVRAAHGDIPVPVPAVARLMVGWQTVGLAAATPVHHGCFHSGHSDDGSQHHEHSYPPRQVHDATGPADVHHVPHEGHREPDGGQSTVPRAGHPDHHHDHEGPASVVTAGEGELATPTGMALIRALATRCEGLGDLSVAAIGVGAGGRDTPGRPNVVRVVLGTSPEAASMNGTNVVELAANVDDMDPRLWPGALESCLIAGARDAWLVPIHMKKGRPAFTLHALVHETARDAVEARILATTTTLGIRQIGVGRTVLDRSWTEVDVAGWSIPVKIGARHGRIVNAAVEFDAMPGLAEHMGLPEADVLARATAAIVSAGLTAGSPVPKGAVAEPRSDGVGGLR
ncbi:MAG: LarC family nickel insertion protein [Propioniciclava sp.]